MNLYNIQIEKIAKGENIIEEAEGCQCYLIKLEKYLDNIMDFDLYLNAREINDLKEFLPSQFKDLNLNNYLIN